jgi:SAM-dependent methyltransferase
MELRDHVSHERFELHRCLDCDGLYIRNPPTPERISSYYENASGRVMHKPPGRLFSMLQRIQFLRDVRPLLKRLSPGSRILDLGAGDGALCRFLAQWGYAVQAVDFYPASEWGKAEIPYRSADLNGDRLRSDDLLCGGEMPDAIILRHVLEHLFEPYKVLKLFHDHGINHVLIVVPNADSKFARWLGTNWYYWDPPRHLTFFNPKTLARLAARAGYQVREHKTYGIDEIVSSYFRAKMLEGGPTPSQQGRDRLLKHFNPKSPMAAVSSSLAAFTTSTVCWCLLERSHA